jgi:hypothetical protein
MGASTILLDFPSNSDLSTMVEFLGPWWNATLTLLLWKRIRTTNHATHHQSHFILPLNLSIKITILEFHHRTSLWWIAKVENATVSTVSTILNTTYIVNSSILWVHTFIYHIFIHFNNFSSILTYTI